MAHDHPYGDFDGRSADGKYRFEWTPFTPAIVAWRRAADNLRSARDYLADAGKLEGFAISGLETQHQRFAEGLKQIVTDLSAEVTDAELIVKGLDTANTNYAAADDASYDSYRELMAEVDGVLATQGRPRRLPERAGGV